MKIVGGKVLIDIDKPKLIMGFRPNDRAAISCQDIINDNLLALQALDLWMRDYDRSHCFDPLSIWSGENGCQIYPIEDCTPDMLEFTDINIIGDADPVNTLWFVFEKEEWEKLDRLYNMNLSEKLNEIWNKCEEHMKFVNNMVSTPYDRYNIKSRLDDIPVPNVVNVSINIELPDRI